MLSLLIQSYWTVLLAIGGVCLSIFIVGLILIFRKPTTSKKLIATTEVHADLTAIAGDDIVTTQLDLARALIEAGKKDIAKSIIETIMHQGNKTQQVEARALLGLI